MDEQQCTRYIQDIQDMYKNEKHAETAAFILHIFILLRLRMETRYKTRV